MKRFCLAFCSIVIIFFVLSESLYAERLTVAVLLPSTESAAPSLGMVRRSLELLEKKYKKNINFLFEEAGNSNEETRQALKKLQEEKSLRAVIGSFTGKQIDQLLPEIEKSNLLLLNAEVCEKRHQQSKRIVCMIPSIDKQFLPTLQFLFTERKALHLQSLGVFGNTQEEMSRRMGFIRDFARNRGWPLLIDAHYGDFQAETPQLQKSLVKKSANLLFIGETNAEVLKKIKELLVGLKILPTSLFLLNSSYSDIFQDEEIEAGGQVKGEKGVEPRKYFSPAIPVIQENFFIEFESEFGESPDMYAALAYDSTRYLLETLSVFFQRDAEHIRSGMQKLLLPQGAIHGFQISSDGHADCPLQPQIWQDGKKVDIHFQK